MWTVGSDPCCPLKGREQAPFLEKNVLPGIGITGNIPAAGAKEEKQMAREEPSAPDEPLDRTELHFSLTMNLAMTVTLTMKP